MNRRTDGQTAVSEGQRSDKLEEWQGRGACGTFWWLRSRAGAHADAAVDKVGIVEAHWDAIDQQQPHAAHVWPPGGAVLGQEKI